MILLGVEKVVTDLPSHSEPCMRLSPHTAPSLIVPLLRIQLDFFGCHLGFHQLPIYHRDSGGVVIEGFCIHPFRLSLEGECGQLQLNPME